MNKIVREHYPVANLPEDMRGRLEPDATVRVVIESGEPVYPGFEGLGMPERKPLTIEQTLEMIKCYKAEGRRSVSSEEAAARIRELRDEWDD